MNVIREIERINARELENGIYGGSGKGSWHEKYKNSAWVYVGGLPYELTEGDIICVMSQWGEIEDINLVREKGTNKSQGFAFVKYEDQRSTILAVDNFNGIEILQRTIRVDHVDQYKLPKEVREREEELLDENPDADVNIGPGHAYKSEDLMNGYSISSGVNHWEKPSSSARLESMAVLSHEVSVDKEKRSGGGKKKKKQKDKKDSKENKLRDTKKKHKRQSREDVDTRDAEVKRYRTDQPRECGPLKGSTDRNEDTSPFTERSAAKAVFPPPSGK